MLQFSSVKIFKAHVVSAAGIAALMGADLKPGAVNKGNRPEMALWGDAAGHVFFLLKSPQGSPIEELFDGKVYQCGSLVDRCGPLKKSC